MVINVVYLFKCFSLDYLNVKLLQIFLKRDDDRDQILTKNMDLKLWKLLSFHWTFISKYWKAGSSKVMKIPKTFINLRPKKQIFMHHSLWYGWASIPVSKEPTRTFDKSPKWERIAVYVLVELDCRIEEAI